MTRAAFLFSVVAFGCERGAPPAPRPAASAAPVERPCRLSAGAPIPIASELGQKLDIAPGTTCVVLDAAPALTRVRITDGPYAGTVGWTQSAAVVASKSK